MNTMRNPSLLTVVDNITKILHSKNVITEDEIIIQLRALNQGTTRPYVNAVINQLLYSYECINRSSRNDRREWLCIVRPNSEKIAYWKMRMEYWGIDTIDIDSIIAKAKKCTKFEGRASRYYDIVYAKCLAIMDDYILTHEHSIPPHPVTDKIFKESEGKVYA